MARLEQALASRVPRTVEDPTRHLAAVAVIIVPEPDAVLQEGLLDQCPENAVVAVGQPGRGWVFGRKSR